MPFQVNFVHFSPLSDRTMREGAADPRVQVHKPLDFLSRLTTCKCWDIVNQLILDRYAGTSLEGCALCPMKERRSMNKSPILKSFTMIYSEGLLHSDWFKTVVNETTPLMGSTALFIYVSGCFVVASPQAITLK